MKRTPRDVAKAAAFARAMARSAFGKNFVSDDQLAEIRRASTKPTTAKRPETSNIRNPHGAAHE